MYSHLAQRKKTKFFHGMDPTMLKICIPSRVLKAKLIHTVLLSNNCKCYQKPKIQEGVPRNILIISTIFSSTVRICKIIEEQRKNINKKELRWDLDKHVPTFYYGYLRYI